MSDHNLKAELSKELSRLSEDILYTEKAHFAGADTWGRAHWIIGVATVVAGVASAAAIIVSSVPIAGAVFALVASAGGALQTWLKPGDNQASRTTAGRELGALRVEIRQMQSLRLPGATDQELATMVAEAREIAKRKAAIDEKAPAVPPSAYRAGKKLIQGGEFEHDSVTSD